MRTYIVNLARKLIGTPYIWGGSDPRGFDCSGFVVWIYQVFEILPKGDWNTDALLHTFPPIDIPQIGDMAFYGTRTVEGTLDASHVMMVCEIRPDQIIVVGASGGGSKTLTVEDAKKIGAEVHIRPHDYRKDFIGFRAIPITVSQVPILGTIG